MFNSNYTTACEHCGGYPNSLLAGCACQGCQRFIDETSELYAEMDRQEDAARAGRQQAVPGSLRARPGLDDKAEDTCSHGRVAFCRQCYHDRRRRPTFIPTYAELGVCPECAAGDHPLGRGAQ